MARLSIPLALVVAAVSGGSPAAAQQPPEGAQARFVFVPVEAGALRLNTATGEVSICATKDGAGACTAVPDEGGADGGEAAALQRRLAALEARLAAVEARDPVETLNDEETMDRVVVLADRMMRRFITIMRGIKDDVESGAL